MGFFIEDNLFLTDEELIEKRKKIMYQKIKLLQQFRNYVLNYLINHGETLNIEYELINGDPNFSFENLEIGETFDYMKVSFKFNLKTNVITQYLRSNYKLTKLNDKKNIGSATDIDKSRPRIINRTQCQLSMLTELEHKKIEIRKNKKVDSILDKVFKGLITFKDDRFKKIVQVNAYLENEKREIDDLLNPKNNGLGHKNKI